MPPDITLEHLKRFEGRYIHFLGDADMAPRGGLITDVFEHPGTTFFMATVLWDSDEFIGTVEGKQQICTDSGCATYCMPDLLNRRRFTIS